jgi:hypothetical protein
MTGVNTNEFNTDDKMATAFNSGIDEKFKDRINSPLQLFGNDFAFAG